MDVGVLGLDLLMLVVENEGILVCRRQADIRMLRVESANNSQVRK